MSGALVAAAQDAVWIQTAAVDGEDDGPLFDSATTNLTAIAGPDRFGAYMTAEAQTIIGTATALTGQLLQICNRSPEEQAFCESVKMDLSLASVEAAGLPDVAVVCVQGESIDDCAA